VKQIYFNQISNGTLWQNNWRKIIMKKFIPWVRKLIYIKIAICIVGAGAGAAAAAGAATAAVDTGHRRQNGLKW
jgi:hypothetical protein